MLMKIHEVDYIIIVHITIVDIFKLIGNPTIVPENFIDIHICIYINIYMLLEYYRENYIGKSKESELCNRNKPHIHISIEGQSS